MSSNARLGLYALLFLSLLKKTVVRIGTYCILGVIRTTLPFPAETSSSAYKRRREVIRTTLPLPMGKSSSAYKSRDGIIRLTLPYPTEKSSSVKGCLLSALVIHSSRFSTDIVEHN